MAPASHSGAAGGNAGSSTWTVVATKTVTLGGFAVTGTVTVTNNNDVAVPFTLAQSLDDGTGGLIDSQTEVGGYPELRTGDVPKDQDQDGIPDDWERTHRLDPTNAKDAANDQDGDGYTNIEEYLNNQEPREWESIQVPEELRTFPDHGP